MNFVEIIDKQPRLSGGRRGNANLQPGGTNVNSSLVPISQLPASAGSLADVMATLKPKKAKKSAGAVPQAEDMSWKRIAGKMSSLIPPHGHGASTQIGTNYKLGQFGGSMTQPIGNLAPTLSPALSVGSVGAGRAKKGGLPKGKNIVNFLKTMVKAKKQMSGSGFLEDAWKEVKNVVIGLYHEFGPQIFNEINHLKDAILQGAGRYIKGMEGGDFWSDVWDGLKSVGRTIFNSLKDLLNSDFFKEIEHELLQAGLEIGKDALAGWLWGAGMPGGDGHGVRTIGGTMIFDPKSGKYIDVNNRITPKMPGNQNKPKYGYGGDMDMPDMPVYKMKGGKSIKPIGSDPKTWTPSNLPVPGKIPGSDPSTYSPIINNNVPGNKPDDFIKLIDDAIKKGKITKEQGEMMKRNRLNLDGGKKQSGVKRTNARGAIVSKIMKEKGLSLPMASKYVKEHGLY
jgi:hypothetical protein